MQSNAVFDEVSLDTGTSAMNYKRPQRGKSCAKKKLTVSKKILAETPLLLPYTYFLNTDRSKHISIGFEIHSFEPIVLFYDVGKSLLELSGTDYFRIFNLAESIESFFHGVKDTLHPTTCVSLDEYLQAIQNQIIDEQFIDVKANTVRERTIIIRHGSSKKKKKNESKISTQKIVLNFYEWTRLKLIEEFIQELIRWYISSS